MSTLNVDLLRRMMEHIEAHPEQHNQGWWALQTPCGTTYCLAGRTVALADPTAEFSWLPGSGQAVRLADGRRIEVVAQDLLGLADWQADRLFYALDVDRLRRIVDELIESAASVAS